MPASIAFVPARNIVGAPRTPIVVAPPSVKPATTATTTTTTTTTSLPTAKEEGKPILLFNDQCEVCHALSAWVKRQDAAGGDLIDERPIGDDPEALKKLDPRLDIWDVYKEIHLLMPDGSIKVGGAAIGEVLRRLPHLHWLGPVLKFPPAEWTLDGAYKLLDALRPAIGCKSCGGGPVAWWAKPVQWASKLVRWLRGEDV